MGMGWMALWLRRAALLQLGRCFSTNLRHCSSSLGHWIHAWLALVRELRRVRMRLIVSYSASAAR